MTARPRTDWECARTRELCKELTELGAMCHVAQAGRTTGSGWPDRHVTHRLWAGWLEMKVEAKELTRKQECMLAQLHGRQPGSAFVVRHREAGGMSLCKYDGVHALAECANAGQLLLALAACSDLRLMYGSGSIMAIASRCGWPSFLVELSTERVLAGRGGCKFRLSNRWEP